MNNVRMWPSRPEVGQSFEGSKVVTVPQQSMTLKEIIRRFIRKESLPIEKDGMYAEGFGDLEKLSKEDVTVQHERAADLKDKLSRAKARMEAKEAAEKADKEKAEAAAKEPPPAKPEADTGERPRPPLSAK